jgi:uncharacterized SAM-binding protein YcdF (DUF218 family)
MGIVLLFSVIMSFTDYPFWAYYWLGTYNAELTKEPDILVVMGGGGMPSPDGLIRCYYAANMADHYPETGILIAMPGDTALHEESPELLMAHELIIRGIDSTRISFENEGHNTHSQALNIKEMLLDKNPDSIAIRIVTSPDHMFRCVATFRKAGFKHVGGRPSFEEAVDEKMLIRKNLDKKQLKAESRNLSFRYNMWNYMKYEITVMREWCAIAYYKIRGWI